MLRDRFSVALNAAVAVTVLACAACAPSGEPAADAGPMLMIERQGSLAGGGSIIGDARQASLHCDHGVVTYQIPAQARATNLFMWHSASAAAWLNRWDGGEGFQSIFLRRGYPVYIWDGPRVGRADWGCEAFTYEPALGQDQRNFISWRFGSAYPNWFDGVQFPTDDEEAYHQAMRARYQEFDTVENILLQSDAGAAMIDRIGPSVALTNSAGGLRALMAALKSDNLRAVVAYENVGYVFPIGEGPDIEQGPYGPIEVPLDEFMALTEIPIQLVWGDNVEQVETFAAALEQSRDFVEVVNRHGGQAEILILSDAGLHGNTHIPFADMNNVAVADLLSAFLSEHGLD